MLESDRQRTQKKQNVLRAVKRVDTKCTGVQRQGQHIKPSYSRKSALTHDQSQTTDGLLSLK